VTHDTFELQEDPAMGKRLKKTEKLDLILSELAKLRGEVKKLARERAADTNQGVKVKAKSPSGQPRKPPTPTGAGKNPDRDETPSRQVLVQAPLQPTGRTASQ
jgi:hypothetical protein